MILRAYLRRMTHAVVAKNQFSGKRSGKGLGLVSCHQRAIAAACLLVLFPEAGSTAGDAIGKRNPRILMLHPYNENFPSSTLAAMGATKRLTEHYKRKFELYSDFLDLVRFPGAQYRRLVSSHLSQKYTQNKPDLIFALDAESLRFSLRQPHTFGPTVPIIFCCASPHTLQDLEVPSNVVGIVSEYDLRPTVELATRLQPHARHLFVIAGAGETDLRWVARARQQLIAYESHLEMTYLIGLERSALLDKVAAVPSSSIVLTLPIFKDSAGRPQIPREIIREVATVANAPVYGPFDTLIGEGIVGGYMDSYEAIGEAAADLAIQVLSGKDPRALPTVSSIPHRHIVDARQLARWSLSAANLPANTEVRFGKPSVWDQYRWHIIAICTALLLQGAALAWLFWERRRRRKTEVELQRRLMEVTHLNRSATAGALSASVAHELAQPLGAIQSSAEAAALYLHANPPNIKRIGQILENIQRDDQRAAAIIQHLRGLLKKKDAMELQEFDFNEVLRASLDVLRPEAVKRGVEINADQTTAPLPVRAEKVHVQQVVLNLVMNGMDALQNCPRGRQSILIRAESKDGSEVAVVVQDSGAGIPREALNEVFNTFYTTKSHGTGLGLSIARAIVETYGGRIWAENDPGGGAVFRFTLPLAKSSSKIVAV
jgi:signal transduction histidine kinase